MMDLWIFVYYLIAFILAFYVYTIWEASYFKRRGIKNLPFDCPIIGNMYKAIRQQEHFLDAIYRIYNAFPNEKYVGFMQINRPLIIIKDLDLIKQITIKDFDHFLDHFVTVDEDLDSLFGSNLFALKGDKWKDMRATLSPAFTSSKMRGMFMLIDEIGEQMRAHFHKQLDNNERGLIEVDMKDAFTRYTNDVIATTAFGLNVNSLDKRDNEFYEMVKLSSDFIGWKFIKFFLSAAFPSITKLVRVEIFGENIKRFFSSLVLDTMKFREKHGSVRPDMIQLLMEAKKGSLKYETAHDEKNDVGFATTEESNIGKRIIKRKWTDNDIVAQALLFFVAGFETVSTLLTFLSHELTLNPDVQKKLQDEIDDVIREKGDKADYNDLMKMKYLDMVVTETLRKWPPIVASDRACIKPYTLPPPNDSTDKGCIIQPGEGISIPIYGIHHDPQYYPNPKKFLPERFSDENRSKLNPNTFLSFGIGPRNCLGSRFALMEVKIVIFHLLSQFDFVPTAKTQNPIKLSKKSFNLRSENGTWIGIQSRNI